jgi:hypothetical protein
MFYILIFSLMAVLLVFAFLSTVSRRRRNLAREEGHVSHSETHAVHGETHAMHGETHAHGDDATRRNRKAKRAQSQHDRRKRH